MRHHGGAEDYVDVEDQLVQLLLAFSQGAGSHLLSIDAIRTAREQYGDAIRKNVENWQSALPAALFFARSLGAVAAHLAAGEGRQFIEPSDFIEAIRRSAKEPRIDCPFCE